VAAKRNHIEFWRLKKPGQLTPEETACVVIALDFYVDRIGSIQAAAYKMGVDRTFLRRALKSRPKPGITLALEVARAAGVTVDDVLAGRYPRPGECARCHRYDPPGDDQRRSG
jgi:hypothetical protein